MGALFTYAAFVFICAGALVRPSIGMVGYIGFVAFVPHWLWRFSLHDPSFPFQKYIAAATIIGFAIQWFPGGKLSRSSKLSIAAFVFYLAVSYISALQSIVPEASWFFLDALYKQVLMACIAAKLLCSSNSIKAAMLCIVAGVGWNAFEINADYFRRGYSLVNQEGWAYLNANGYALILLVATFLSLSMALHARTTFRKFAFLVPAILDVHAIYILESRGGMLGLIAAGIVLFALMEKSKPNLLLAGLAVAAAGVLAGPSVVKEFTSSFAKQLDHSADSRYYIWDAGLRITADYPLLGVGPWAAEHLVPSYYKGANEAGMDRLHLHNLPLEVSTGSGVPALLAYCTFFFLPLYSAFRMHRARIRATDEVFQMVFLGVSCALSGYWLASMFNSGALIEIPYFCVALLIAASGARPDAALWSEPDPETELADDAYSPALRKSSAIGSSAIGSPGDQGLGISPLMQTDAASPNGPVLIDSVDSLPRLDGPR